MSVRYFRTPVKSLLVIIGWLIFASTLSSTTPAMPPRPDTVSMVALLASPEKHDRLTVKTFGFLNIGKMPEDDNLWLHKEDFDANLSINSLALVLSPAQRDQFRSINHTYVLIEGTFNARDKGDGWMASGTIEHITQIGGWSPYRQPQH